MARESIMTMADEEVVSIRLGQRRGDPSVITINCPGKLGLACDLSRIIFDFGLVVSRLDLSTDGHWCLVIFWVLLQPNPHRSIKWAMLKRHLIAACPSTRAPLYQNFLPQPKQQEAYVLQIFCQDRIGLLNDIVYTLWEQEFIIHKVKANTTPEGKAFGLFYITDCSDVPENKKGQDGIESLGATLKASNLTYKIGPTFPEWGGLECVPSSLLSLSVTDNLINEGLPDLEPESKEEATSNHGSPLSETLVIADNALSPAHTLLQVSCKDRKGLLYDCMRTLKDLEIQVAYGRLSTMPKGTVDIDVFVFRPDGKKLIEPKSQDIVCSRLESEIMNPIRVMIIRRGPDMELLIATPMESSGRNRPQALHDSTLALKRLNICIFKADVGRHLLDEKKWEIYRFLLVDTPELRLADSGTRRQIVARVREALMG